MSAVTKASAYVTGLYFFAKNQKIFKKRKEKQMNELTTLTNIEDAVKVQAPVIDFNFESMKATLSAKMSDYNSVAFGDDSSVQEQYKSMKSDRVELNKAVKTLTSMDSAIRKQVLAPFDEYKQKSGELKSIIEGVLVPLDEKVKEIEKYWKDEKLNNLKNIYAELSADIDEDYKPILFEKIFSDSWTNQTTSLKKATGEMEELIEKYRSGLTLVKSLNSDFEDEGINILKETLDVTKAVTKMQDLNAQKERAIAAERARLEEQKQKEIAEAKKKAEEEAQAKAQAILDEQMAQERAKLEAEAQEKANREAEALKAKEEAFEAKKKADEQQFAKEKNAFYANATMNQQAANLGGAANTVAAEGKSLIEVPTVALKAITRYLDSLKIEYTVK